MESNFIKSITQTIQGRSIFLIGMMASGKSETGPELAKRLSYKFVDLDSCIEAISKGVNEATILDGRISHALILELFTEHGIGTQIYSKINVKNKK